MIPQDASALFLALFENSKNSEIRNAMQHLLINDIITRIQTYTIIFMTKENMTIE
jgi:hypothetical protein